MGKSGKISQYRERLDKTLASPELTNRDALKTLIRNQLVHSSVDENEGFSDHLIENKTDHVGSFLDMLRSASVSENEVSRTSETSHSQWKIKEDHEDVRVMYRPGPQGTPFHTLLVEGYVDGTVDTCLCISWEAPLYKKWWPQYSFPPFKVTICECLQKIRTGEELALVRVKVTWPLTTREAVIHNFLFEYLQDDLVVVLINTISDLEGINRTTHGFSKDGIPEAKDVVRIDVVGGFAIQKVTPERSYFRTIANMDMKLDFVPPSLINFISRQLIGNGFRLYQKAVASVSNFDEDYCKALEGPMYARVRKVLYHTDNTIEVEGKEPDDDARLPQQELSAEGMRENLGEMELNIRGDDDASEAFPENTHAVDNKSFGAIEEADDPEGRHLKNENFRDMELYIHGDDDASEAFPENAQAVDSKSFGEIKEANNQDTGHVRDEKLGDRELDIHGDGDASKASPEDAQAIDNNFVVEIEEENNQDGTSSKDEMRGKKVHFDDYRSESWQNISVAADRKTVCEIEEESEDSRIIRDCGEIGQSSSNKMALLSPENRKRNIRISSDVGRALETLEKAIAVVREFRFNSQLRSFSFKSNEETPTLGTNAKNDQTHLQDNNVHSNAEVSAEVSRKGRPVEKTSPESRNGSSHREIRSVASKETNHNKITPASPDEYIWIPSETNHVALYSSENGTAGVPDCTRQQATELGGKWHP